MRLMVIADPLESLDPAIDTTLGLIRSAARHGHQVQHCELHDLAVVDGRARARARNVGDTKQRWVDLDACDAVLFRTDPPVDRHYLDATFILDRVDTTGTVLVNDPRGIRIANEKMWGLQYPQLCPPTLVAADSDLISGFVAEHGRCVVKPIDGFAGRGVLQLDARDRNRRSIVELLTERGRRAVVVQPWLDEVREGNKRIFLHGGEPAGAVLRYPADEDFRIGMPARVVDLSPRDRDICRQIGPDLIDLGLVLVGIDVIGTYLIEVNVTSSGALYKADRLLGTSMCDDFIHLLETNARRTS
jgi:glutathione synthase